MDLDAYFARIGMTEPPPLTPGGLAMLQAAHRQSIAFENLDIMLGRPVLIDSASVFAKLVTRGRGGYCFEQNRLFADVLTIMGLPNRPLLARTWLQAPENYTPPRTHVLLLVEVDGKDWIADAGFGGSYVPPMPLRDGAEVQTADGARHRLRRLSRNAFGDWQLQRAGPVEATDGRAAAHKDWQTQYSFDLVQVAPEDLEQCSHWTSTRAGIRHTSLHITSIVLSDGFASMNGTRLAMFEGGETTVRELTGPDAYHEALTGLFRLRIDLDEVRSLALFA